MSGRHKPGDIRKQRFQEVDIILKEGVRADLEDLLSDSHRQGRRAPYMLWLAK